MLVRQVRNFFQQRGQIQIVQVLDVHILVEHRVRVGHQLVPVRLGRCRAHGHNGVDHFVKIPVNQRQDQVLEHIHIRVGDPPDHTEIDPDRLSVADHQIALMGVGMERAHIQHLVNVVVKDHGTDLFRIIAVLDQPVLLGDGIAVHKRHRKDALGGQLVDHRRAGNLLFVVDTVLLEEARIFRFHSEIQLFVRHLFQLIDNRYQVDHLFAVIVGLADHVNEAAQLLQQHKVFAHHLRDQRALHLRHDLRAVLQHGIVGLADGRGSQGLVPEFLIDLTDLLARFLLDHGLGDLGIQFLHVLPQFLKLPAVAFRQHIHAAGPDLADLDICRTQVFQRGAQFFGREAVGVEIVLGKHGHNLNAAGLFPFLHVLEFAGQQLLHPRAQFFFGMLQGLLAAVKFLLPFPLAPGGGILLFLLFIFPLGLPGLLFLDCQGLLGFGGFLARLFCPFLVQLDFLFSLLDCQLRFSQLGLLFFDLAHCLLFRSFRRLCRFGAPGRLLGSRGLLFRLRVLSFQFLFLFLSGGRLRRIIDFFRSHRLVLLLQLDRPDDVQTHDAHHRGEQQSDTDDIKQPDRLGPPGVDQNHQPQNNEDRGKPDQQGPAFALGPPCVRACVEDPDAAGENQPQAEYDADDQHDIFKDQYRQAHQEHNQRAGKLNVVNQ